MKFCTNVKYIVLYSLDHVMNHPDIIFDVVLEPGNEQVYTRSCSYNVYQLQVHNILQSESIIVATEISNVLKMIRALIQPFGNICIFDKIKCMLNILTYLNIF